jgi:syntaxin 6
LLLIQVVNSLNIFLIVQPIIENSPIKVPAISHGTTKYSKLENEIDSPNRQFHNGIICNQSSMTQHHDGQLDVMSDNTDSLKTVSQQINYDFDEQQVLVLNIYCNLKESLLFTAT